VLPALAPWRHMERRPDLLWERVLQIGWDMNRDGQVTISDVPLWFSWLFFLPGDLVLLLLLGTTVGNFLEISRASLGGFGSGILSVLFVWLPVYGSLMNLTEGGPTPKR